MIKVTNLQKSYGSVQALRGVNLKITEGEIVGLLGPNGAGKTTIIKTLTGYLQPDEGKVLVDGLNVMNEARQVQERLGYLPENAPLYPELTVLEYLQMMAGLRQIPKEEEAALIDTAVTAVGLTPRLNQPIAQLSKGYRQRVGLAQAILHQPKLLILDEPTIGLDPTQIVEIRKLIKQLAQHSTILFSTHILSEVEALCDRVIILMHGEVKLDARLSELGQTHDALLTLDGRPQNVEETLSQLQGVRQVELLPGANGHATYRIRGEETADLCPSIYQLAVKQQWPVRELRQEVQNLERVFNELATTA